MNTPQQDRDGGAPQQPARLAPGTTVDNRYEIVEFIGAGGFATVYRARHVHMERLVALKLLSPAELAVGEFASGEYEARFLREAQAAAAVQHSNVVTIHDFGFAEQGPYIVMELLEGHDLAEELAINGPLEPQRAIDLLTPCLEALGDGHEQHVIHRDIKPTNLFVARPGTKRESLVILDFGVAHLASGIGAVEIQDVDTAPGVFLGTPAYLAPEWIKDHTLTPALDVYQMGLILVEMLTGERVVDAYGLYGCMAVHASGRLAIPDWVLESPLGPVVRRAVALDVQQRYPDGHAFGEALSRVDGRFIASPALDVGGDTLKERAIQVLDSGAHVYAGSQSTGVGVQASGESIEGLHDTGPVSDAALDYAVATHGPITEEVSSFFPPSEEPTPPIEVAGYANIGNENDGISASLLVQVDELVGADRRRRGLIAAVVVAVLLVAVGAIVWVLVTTEPPEEPSDSPTPRQVAKQITPPLVTSARIGPAGRIYGMRIVEEQRKKEQKARLVSQIDPAAVVFRVTPAGAEIFRDEVLIGTTPTAIKFYEPDEVNLLFKKPGYAPLRLAITPEHGMVVERSMERRHTRRRTRRRTRTMQIAP